MWVTYYWEIKTKLEALTCIDLSISLLLFFSCRQQRMKLIPKRQTNFPFLFNFNKKKYKSFFAENKKSTYDLIISHVAHKSSFIDDALAIFYQWRSEIYTILRFWFFHIFFYEWEIQKFTFMAFMCARRLKVSWLLFLSYIY